MKKTLISLLICVSLVQWTNNSLADDDLFGLDFSMFIADTFGVYAKCSDVAGIAEVLEGEPPINVPYYSPQQTGYYIFRVIHPFMGCVSNQEVRVRRENKIYAEEPSLDLLQTNPDEYHEKLESRKQYLAYVPTNHARIVFSVGTNKYDRYSVEAANWNVLPHDIILQGPRRDPNQPPPPPLYPPQEIPVFRMFCEPMAWWNDTPENQPLTTHFSNAVMFVRTERNWTNYYELCRSGLTNTNTRVRKTSELDMSDLIYSANDAQLQYMLNDPFHPVEFKTPRIEYLIEDPIWRYPPNRRMPGLPDVPLDW